MSAVSVGSLLPAGAAYAASGVTSSSCGGVQFHGSKVLSS